MQTLSPVNFEPSNYSPLAGMAKQTTAAYPSNIGSTTGATTLSNYYRPITQSAVQQLPTATWGASNISPSGLTSGVPMTAYSGATTSPTPYTTNLATTAAPPSAYQNYQPFTTTSSKVSPLSTVRAAAPTSGVYSGPAAGQYQAQPLRQTIVPAGLPSGPAKYVSPHSSFVANNVNPTNVTTQLPHGLTGFTGHGGAVHHPTANPAINTLNPQYSTAQPLTAQPTASYLTAPNSMTSYVTAPNAGAVTSVLPTTIGVGSYAQPMPTAQYYTPAATAAAQSFPAMPQAPQQYRQPAGKAYVGPGSLSMMEDRVLGNANKFGVIEFPPKPAHNKSRSAFHSLPRRGVGCFN